MRIGLDASFLAADAVHTGMGVYARNLAQSLAALDAAEIFLLGYGPRPAAAPANLRWHALPPLPVGRLGRWLSHQLVLPLVVRKLRLDVLHVTGVNLRLSRPGVPLVSPCPLVVTLHDVIPLVYYGRSGPRLPWRLRLAYRFALVAVRRAAAVITVSETSRRDILAHLRLGPERVRTIHNGVDFEPPIDAAQAAKTLAKLGVRGSYLLYAGSYEPRKNLVGTIAGYGAALRRRSLPQLVVLVEPESGYRAAVMEQVRGSGLADRLTFLDSLSDAEVQALYAGADLLLYPSLYEGFGFVPLQAMACGVPVISSRMGALFEVLSDAAYYVDPLSPESLAEAILDVLEHPEKAAELRARGRARAALFRWDSAARATLETYHLATAGPSSESIGGRNGVHGVVRQGSMHGR